ncbi:glycosyltransferase family 2 protein [Candidatus Pacearchaeota archaeon]|nr:glycosyltransferase family 2 protein [Candidatus Pacearchaeota archaeon]
MIHIIITAYGEPNSTIRCINSFLSQKIKQNYKIIVADPFPETEKIIKKEFKNNKKIEFFLDPGEGKSYALNTIFEKIYSTPEDIIILTDGDVYVSNNTVSAFLEAFKDKEIGAATGQPVSVDSRETMFGFWSHLLFAGIDSVRKELSEKKQFFECSGYLFAIRNGVLQGFPLETSEDSIIPYLFWKKNYKIKYLPEIEVYVKNPGNWKDWKLQKIRNIKGHENLNKLEKEMPRTKSFFNEIKKGTFFALTYPKTIKEFVWTMNLFIARLYIYLIALYQTKIKKSSYQDGWRTESTESTRSLD